MRLLFAVLGLLLIILGMTWGTPIGLHAIAPFVDVASLSIVGGGTVAFTLATHGPHDVIEGFNAALFDKPLTEEQARRSVNTLRTGRSVALSLGGVGSLIGLIQLLANMEDPTSIGPAMAVALLSCFYAIIVGELLCAPLINRVVARGGPSTTGEQPTMINRRAAAPLSALFVVLGLTSLLPVLLLQNEFGVMIDYVSVGLLLGLLVCWGAANHSLAELAAAVTAGLRGASRSEGGCVADIAVLATLRGVAVGVGALGMLIGMVKMLSGMDDPTAIGPALAVACLMLLYGLFVGEVVLVMMMNRLNADNFGLGGVLSLVAPSKLGHVLFGPMMCVCTFFVMILAVANFD